MNDYVQPVNIRREDLASLTSLPTPPWEQMTRDTYQAFLSAHAPTCPMCGGDEAPYDCEQFTPARMRGICHTMYVVVPWTETGDLPAYVISVGESGPVWTVDKIGPFADLPAAMEWAASVAVAEIRREMS